jgi:anti-sigma B factor antagonist
MSQTGLVISQVEGVTIVMFREAAILDMSAVEGISKDLYALVDQQAIRKIVLDFSTVRFLSSQMIGVLIKLQAKAAAIKGRVVLCGLQGELHKVFKITRLDKIMEFAPNEDEAMNRLRGPGRT